MNQSIDQSISQLHLKREALGQCIPLPRHVLPVSRYGSGFGTYPGPWSGSPPKFNRLFIGSLLTFPENFM